MIAATIDRCYKRRLSLTMLTMSHMDLEDFSHHFAPPRFFDGTIIGTAAFDLLALFFSWF